MTAWTGWAEWPVPVHTFNTTGIKKMGHLVSLRFSPLTEEVGFIVKTTN